jgi:hypothetical protein
MNENPTVVIRRARPEDSTTVGHLTALDSARPLYGDVMLAVVDGATVAAMSLADGRVVADPFTRSARAAGMLREYAAGLRRAA